jgi:peptidoglycan hydrolase-like protein with peptidoglycan-binding domain
MGGEYMSLGFSLSNLPLLANSTGYLAVEDTFDRPNGTIEKVGEAYSLASYITDGRAAWDVLVGSFSIYNNKLLAGSTNILDTPTASGIAVINNGSTNVLMSASISDVGGDGLYFRVIDENNWSRVYLTSEVETTTTPVGYYEYEWQSSASVSNYVSIYKDTNKYYPSQTTCKNSVHDHEVLITTNNPQISQFDPLTLKWGKYPYMMVKRGIRYKDLEGNIIASTGDDVKYLQGVLRHHYDDDQMVVDGYFGPYTESQLKRLQREENIIVDGFAWNLQSWLVIDRLAIAAINMGTSVEAERTLYLRRYLLGSTYHFPTKTIWGASPDYPPEGVYTDITHTHDLLLDNCRHISTVGAHTHYALNTLTGASTFIQTAEDVVETTTTYSIVAEECIDGQVSAIDLLVSDNFDQTNTETISSIKLLVYDNYLEISVNNYPSAQYKTYTLTTANTAATKHGVGRGPADAEGTGIDDYVCVPIDAMITPSEV